MKFSYESIEEAARQEGGEAAAESARRKEGKVKASAPLSLSLLETAYFTTLPPLSPRESALKKLLRGADAGREERKEGRKEREISCSFLLFLVEISSCVLLLLLPLHSLYFPCVNIYVLPLLSNGEREKEREQMLQ